MKKFFKITAIVLVLLAVVLVATPFLFRGKLIETAKREINKNLDAKVEFSDVRVSLIRNFPNLHVAMTDLSVSGTGQFENDTLVSFDAFRGVVDIMTLIRGEGVSVVSVRMDKPLVTARVAGDGSANWDIMAEKEEEPEEPETGTFEFSVDLQRFEIRNGRFIYDDAPFLTRVTLSGLDMVMEGDLTQDLTSLDIESTAQMFNLWYDDIRYISDAALEINTLMDADLNDFRFTFTGGDVTLNLLQMGVDGFMAFPPGKMEMDLSFHSQKTGLETLLSMVPGVFMEGMDDITTGGEISVEGFARGVMGGGVMPVAGLDVKIDDGSFSYPGLPESARNIMMDMELLYDGEDEDNSHINLNRFYAEMAGNPFEMNLRLTNPVSDPAVDAGINGKIDFGGIAGMLPLEGVTLKGILDAGVSINGVLSRIEQERYEEFMAEGHLELDGFEYSGDDLPEKVAIPAARFEFSPRFVEMTEMDFKMGETEMAMNGRLENFIPYLFSDGVVRGNLALTSPMIDLNELLPEPEEPAEEDPAQLSVVEVPDNIDFTFTSSIGKVRFAQAEATDVGGTIRVAGKKVMMDNLSMGLCEGSFALSGEYNTTDMENPYADMSMSLRGMDIPSAFHTFNTMQALTPIARDLRGSFSADMSFRTVLGEDFTPLMNTVAANGRLQTSRVEVVSSRTFDRLASVLKLSDDYSNVLRDLYIDFRIENGRVMIDPVHFSMGDIEMMIAGDQGLDQTMNYRSTMKIPRSAFGSGANELFDDLVARASSRGFDFSPGENVEVDVNIAGTFSDPEISVRPGEGMATAASRIKEEAKERVTEEVERRVEEAEEKVREEVRERVERILEEAERRAEQVKKEAERAAEKVKEEAESKAQRIEEEAKGRGRLAELAAQRSADKIREEAENTANKLMEEAEKKADSIVKEARKEAEKIKNSG